MDRPDRPGETRHGEPGGARRPLPRRTVRRDAEKAGLARAMALDPGILFFDEPFSGLDSVTSAELEILIRRIRSAVGSTMIMVSHDLPSLFNLADRIILLDRGARGILAEGDPREMKRNAVDGRVVRFLHRAVPDEKPEEVGNEERRVFSLHDRAFRPDRGVHRLRFRLLARRVPLFPDRRDLRGVFRRVRPGPSGGFERQVPGGRRGPGGENPCRPGQPAHRVGS